MQAYTDGIWSQNSNLSLAAAWYWSASSVSNNTSYAWVVNPNYGYTNNGTADNFGKTTPARVVCVAP